MKCQILFSRKNKKNISACRLLKFLPSLESINEHNFSAIVQVQIVYIVYFRPMKCL